MAALSGVLVFLSFPKFGRGIIAWIALIPLFYALRNARPAEGFRLGFLTGFVAQTGILYWIVYVVVQYGRLPIYAGIAAMLLLAAYVALYTACFAMGVAYFRQRGIHLFLAAPLLWTVLEFARSHLLTGFPWENLAYSQYLQGGIIQISDITGIYGITFAIVLVNAVIVEMRPGTGREVRLAGGISVLVVLGAIYGYGHFRAAEIRVALSGAPGIAVSLIQGNIDQSVKWDPRYQKETLEIYRSLSAAAIPAPEGRGGGLLVWPETAAPFYFQRPDSLQAEVVDIGRRAGVSLLFGSPSYEENVGRMDYMNSAYLLRPDGTVSGRYDKVHLVPYGEYVPLRKLFPFVGKMVAGVGDFRPGEGFHSLAADSFSLGVLICYEGIFPEAGRDYKRAGTNLLVNITNDAWFGRTSAPYQHLSMTVFRAVENRLYLVRAANTGISAIVDPAGTILNRTGIFERTVLKGEVKFIDIKTFYASYGDMFVYICGMALLILLIISIRKRRLQHAGRNS